MSIRVRYFASLRERLGRSEDTLDGARQTTVAQVWRQLNPDLPLPTHILSAVNQEYATPDQSVADGDEVAFFPPVTGG
jgi:molybdopterin synthase sulfur carrier subunit